MTIAVTGASGHLGGLVVQHLLGRGTPADRIVALVRDVDRVGELASRGVVVRAFDYDGEPGALTAALAGVESLLLISGTAMGRRAPQHRAVIDAARAAGVGRVLYTSAPHADASINPVAPEHKLTEEYLVASGVPHLVLRNGWYHENYLPELQSAAQTGTILTAAGDGRVASASRSDLADAAAVLLAGGETGRTYELGGDVAWSYDDLAATFADVLGRDIRVNRVSPEEKAAILGGLGLDAGLIDFVVGVDRTVAAGELGDVTGELSALIGRPTAPLVDTLRAG